MENEGGDYEIMGMTDEGRELKKKPGLCGGVGRCVFRRFRQRLLLADCEWNEQKMDDCIIWITTIGTSRLKGIYRMICYSIKAVLCRSMKITN